jgi:hypothetical protein
VNGVTIEIIDAKRRRRTLDVMVVISDVKSEKKKKLKDIV